MENHEIKCVRCPSRIGDGEVAVFGDWTKAAAVAHVAEQVGWRKTFAGWQCPNHRR